MQTTYPFKRQDPAATSDAQQNIESPSVTPRHHVCRALTNSVNDWKTTEWRHHLNQRVLLPTRRKATELLETVLNAWKKYCDIYLKTNSFKCEYLLSRHACHDQCSHSLKQRYRTTITLESRANKYFYYWLFCQFFSRCLVLSVQNKDNKLIWHQTEISRKYPYCRDWKQHFLPFLYSKYCAK